MFIRATKMGFKDAGIDFEINSKKRELKCARKCNFKKMRRRWGITLWYLYFTSWTMGSRSKDEMEACQEGMEAHSIIKKGP